MPISLSLEEVEEKIKKKHGYNIIMSNFISASKDSADFKCFICDCVWRTIPSKVYNKTGCPKCGGHKKFKYEEVLLIIEKRGCKLISKKYIKSSLPLRIKFPCNHIVKMSLNSFSLGSRCFCEVRKARSEMAITKMEEVIKNKMNSLGFQLVSIKGKSRARVKIEYICKNGHTVIQPFESIKKSSSCKTCNLSEARRGKVSRKQIIFLIRDNGEIEWREKSKKESNYRCVVTGKHFDEIHHLYPLNKIITEGLSRSGVKIKDSFEKLSVEEVNKIIKSIMIVHDEHPLGVCLSKDIHRMFHKKYGYKNFTPKDFYEFLSDMKKEV